MRLAPVVVYISCSVGTRAFLCPPIYRSSRGPRASLVPMLTLVEPSSSKSFDIVLFGATSFVGQLTTEYLISTYGVCPPTFKWAIAGRSEEKLRALKARLEKEVDPTATGLPTIVADSFDGESLDRMVAQAKVVLTAVGPYIRYGSKLVAACAQAGVHYCDLTGESLWVADMINQYHEEAVRTGAKIVPSCGYDSIPADLGFFMMMEHVKGVHGTTATDVRNYSRGRKGGFSGGTLASAFCTLDQLWKSWSSTRRKLADPLLLTPSTERPSGCQPGGFGYDFLAKAWTAMSVFGGHDSKMVYRSASFLRYPSFCYKQVFAFKGLSGFFMAMIASTFLMVMGLLLIPPATRKVIGGLFPAPGEGPCKETRDEGYFWHDFIATVTVDAKELKVHGVVGSDKGDPGYKETAKMFAESSLCLALDEGKLASSKGGVLTPASAMGAVLLERLRKAGMTFKVMQ